MPADPGLELGRHDQAAPLLDWRTRANLTLALLGMGLLLSWHAAVFLTADRVGLTDLSLTAAAAIHGHPLSGLTDADPASPALTCTVWVVLMIVLFGLFVGWAFFWSGVRARRRQARGFASNSQVREGLGEARARESARQSRPGLTDRQRRHAPVSQIGFELGTTTSGEAVVLPLEDHVVIVANTGAGKSRDLMVAMALDAPGALVVTCTRADILDAAATRRAELGRVWVFDPLDRLGWPQPMVWDPVAGCRDGATATARALAFVAGFGADGQGSTNAGFFQAQASSALTRLLHAADLDNRPISDVISWAVDLNSGAQEPRAIIANSTLPEAEPMWAELLRGVAVGGDDTVASSRQTLQQVIEPLALRRVLRWVTPTADIPAFDTAAFAGSTDTLFLVADDNASTNVAPLCAMLLQEVVDAAKTRAARLPGGRLDPPLRLVGDEIANVAPLPKLPNLGTDARGFGLQLVLALQSLGQARQRWGEHGMKALLDNMPAEILLGGLTDTDTLHRAATLVGEVELTRATTSYDPTTGRATNSSEQLHTQKVLRADEARMIPDGHGLLIYRNRPAVLLRMTPWWDRPGGTQISAERAQTEAWRLAGPTSMQA